MFSFFNYPLRLAFRLLWLSTELSRAAVGFLLTVVLRKDTPLNTARASWLQQCCQRVLRVFNLELQVQGPIPLSGLWVCNHLGYLDILALGAVAPAIFVAKREVQFWPVFGWFAHLAGTIFVDRSSKTQVGSVATEIETVLKDGGLVVLFPEGTSSDGAGVLPFKSSLLAPAARTACTVYAGSIEYEIKDGNVGEEVCYWKDMSFVPHLLRLLTKPCIFTRVRISQLYGLPGCRKQMARRLHREVSKLRKCTVR